MSNQLWILVAVAGLIAVTVLWRGWLWVRKKTRLSEQFQRDVRKEIDSLRQHVETLERKELGAFRQQVESLDARQSRDENQRSEQISGLRGQLEGLSTKESEAHLREALGVVRQQVESLDERQSRDESRRSEEITGIRTRLDGLSTKESETHLRETLGTVRQQMEGIEARRSRDDSRRLEEISGLRARLDGSSTKESETQVREELGNVRQQIASLQETQSRDDSRRLEEASSLRARLDGMSSKESVAHLREALNTVHQKVENLQEKQSGDESRRREEISGLRVRLDRLDTKESEKLMQEEIRRIRQQVTDIQKNQAQREGKRSAEIEMIREKVAGLSTKESEARMREELGAVRQQVEKVQERQTHGADKADALIIKEIGARLGEIFGRVGQRVETILDALGKKVDVLRPSGKPQVKENKAPPKLEPPDEIINRKEPDRDLPDDDTSRDRPPPEDRKETPPKAQWNMASHHRVCLLEGGEIDKIKSSIATTLELEERNEGVQKTFAREFPSGDVQMREIGIGSRKGLDVTVRFKEEKGEMLHETEREIERVLNMFCRRLPKTDADLRACSHHFLHGETGAEALLGQMRGQDRDLSLIVLAQDTNKKWAKNYMSALCTEFAGEAAVIRLNFSASWHLTQRLGTEWSCFNGGVRIYRPEWHDQDNTRKHHLFLWRDFGEKIVEQAMTHQESFRTIRTKLPKDSVTPVPDRKPDVLPVPISRESTVQEKVAQAMKDFESGLLFGDNVRDGVSELDATAGPPDKVYRYLSVLNDLAKIKQNGDSLGCDEILWLEEHGCHASRESERGANTGLHKWQVKGVSFEFDKHAKPNDSTRSDRCVRIYYEWGEKLMEKHDIGEELGEQMKGKNVIGWVGRHL